MGPVWSAAQQNTLNSQVSHTLHIQSTSSAPHLDNLLTQFWELESLGITQNEPSVHEAFKKSIQFKNGRYKVSLPWRPNQSQLPTNLELARKRLQGLLKRLRQHPEVQQEYHAVIQEQLRLGIVEKCSDQLRQSSNDTIHYLPHHAIIRTDKQTTKLRIVYDASARDNGPSLNDCLFSGPKFDQSILDILLRFRTYKIALIADIEKTFLMVSVQEEDRNALRFLWVDDVQKSPPIIEEMRFTRVVFGVSVQVRSSLMPPLTITWRGIETGIPTWLTHFCIPCTLMMSLAVQIVKMKLIRYMTFLPSYLQKVVSI